MSIKKKIVSVNRDCTFVSYNKFETVGGFVSDGLKMMTQEGELHFVLFCFVFAVTLIRIPT